MHTFIDKTSAEVPETLKQNIGKLIVVNAGETDPARKIHYTSALITHIRSALMYIGNNAYDPEFDNLLHILIHTILNAEFDYQKAKYARERLNAVFKDKKKLIYDALLMKDVALIQQCRNNWRRANALYFNNADAWEKSNEILADVQDILIEVAIRWNLVIIPKDMPFNINQLPNLTVPMQQQQTTPLDG